ncbi:MAG TPA: hypothetical protein VEY50_11540 [Lysobacter sp.]|nr:hypothetical protein [Lysobacter sp.]
MEKLSVPVAQLEFDLENPRIDTASNQTEALRKLLESESVGREVGRKIYNLARSICRLGFDESERLLVMRHSDAPDRFIVLDGNRRLAALKLLSVPAFLARDDIGLSLSVRNRFTELRRRHASLVLPDVVDVLVSPDRARASPIIALKHSGELDGSGRSAWQTLQQRRFENAGSYQLLVALRARGLLDVATCGQMDNGSYPITTFERAAATTEFAERFGGQITSSDYVAGPTPEVALAAWARIANDTASGAITSRSQISDSDGVKQYLRRIASDVPTNDSRDAVGLSTFSASGSTHGEGVPPASANEAAPAPRHSDAAQAASTDSQAAASASTGSVNVRRRRVSRYLVGRGQLTTISDRKCVEIAKELREAIRVEEAPYAAALLVRALLELTASVYQTTFSLSASTNKTQRIQRMGQDFIAHSRGPSDPADRLQIGQALQVAAGVYDNLSEVAHNERFFISPDHVRATWSTVAPGVILAWQRIMHAESYR